MSPQEWSAAIPVHVNFVKPTTSPGIVELGFIPPDAPNDLSFTIRAVYDDAFLYIAVDVADEALFLGSDPISVWESDAVEVFIDGDRVNGCPPPDDPFLLEWGVYDTWQDCTPQTGINDFYNWAQWEDFWYNGTADYEDLRVEGKEGFQLLSDFQGNNWNWYSPEFQGTKLDFGGWTASPRLCSGMEDCAGIHRYAGRPRGEGSRPGRRDRV